MNKKGILTAAIFCASLVGANLLCANRVHADPAVAPTFSQPTLQPDDTWKFRRTTEMRLDVWRQSHYQVALVRNSGSTMLIRSSEVDSPNPPREILLNADWSSFRSLGGKETVVHRPYVFPLSIGKTWDVDYTDDHPSNKSHKSETRHVKYHVVGWDDIEVPAGKFKALKIEADGTWTGEVAPKTSAIVATQAGAEGTTALTQTEHVTAETVTGRLYQAYWYSPDVKREVKSVEENYDTNGVRSARVTNELESYKVSN